MNETEEITPQAAKSPVMKALRLLTHLAASEEPLALADLSRALKLPKPTGYRLASALVRAGFLQKDPLTSRYLVGANFENIALNALKNGAGHSSRRLLMNELADTIGARVNFVVLKAGNLSFVEWVDTTAPLRVDIRADAPMPVHCTASGKLLLAYGSEALQAHMLRSASFKVYTQNTLTTADQLRREMTLIRRRGHSEDDEELMPGVVCLAVPVRNRSGNVIAGLAVMAPVGSLGLADLRAALPQIKACAEKISTGLGHSANQTVARNHAASRRGGPGTQTAAMRQHRAD